MQYIKIYWPLSMLCKYVLQYNFFHLVLSIFRVQQHLQPPQRQHQHQQHRLQRRQLHQLQQR